ncbi:hypothetical protein [Pendulispora albinea]|uniref:Uncharacterized protein n=1 Tax=Pendulispora albinea TaxID=2741071 RepID=A0ABZ2LN34_9BACT
MKEVERGFECGLSFDGFSDVKAKDIVERRSLAQRDLPRIAPAAWPTPASYEIEEIKPKL